MAWKEEQVRHRKVLHNENIEHISESQIKHVAHHVEVKRGIGLVYELTRTALKIFVYSIVQDAIVYMEHANRKTVSTLDIVYALKRQGMTISGYGG